MHFEPVFRMRDNQPLLTDTQEAFTLKKEGEKRDYSHDPPKKGEPVKKEALEALVAAGGDAGNVMHLMGVLRSSLGFSGKHFKPQI